MRDVLTEARAGNAGSSDWRGHWSNREPPEEVNALVRAFLQEPVSEPG